MVWETADEILDALLDQEGLEVDPINRLEQDTPLHKAVRFINELRQEQWESASSIAELLLDAGADPRSVLLTSFTTMPWDEAMPIISVPGLPRPRAEDR